MDLYYPILDFDEHFVMFKHAYVIIYPRKVWSAKFY